MAKSFDEIVSEVLEKHSDLVESLAEFDTLEYDVQVYLLENKEELSKLLPVGKKREEFHPPELYDIYSAEYAENAVSILRKEISQVFSLDAENSLRIDRKCINMVARDLLSPKGEDNGKN